MIWTVRTCSAGLEREGAVLFSQSLLYDSHVVQPHANVLNNQALMINQTVLFVVVEVVPEVHSAPANR